MSASYNNSAWFYDRLCRVIYGMALKDTQIFLLNFIPGGAKILVAGGGTGWILDEITRIHPEGLSITYVEIAPKMMALSKMRNVGGNSVGFVNAAIEDVPLSADFDVIVTPFLFDNFIQANFERIFVHTHSCLKPGGIWLNCDFQLTGRWWQNVLLKIMFWFFRAICNIEASKLPDIQSQFYFFGYKCIARKMFYRDFIIAGVYRAT
ncbi:MAG TPA: class I SAM-dependent methyltransferase [Mucilaginibacter sp.]|jgi:ubiquinone/menaquinone biosynthesis C-methylase UbiE|nr:class I SAM-dependent methyltransferase [Mucilaginibacter sp.]